MNPANCKIQSGEGMRKTILLLLTVTLAGITAFGQTKPKLSDADKQHEHLSSQLEEIAMCHHAIKAAQHEALEFDQNPYYRYVMEYMGHGHNVFPIPERCKNLATDWIMAYTNMTAKDKADLDKKVFNGIGMTVPDMATDVQFLTVVVNKMTIEGDEANSWKNEDKDIPEP